VGGIFISYRRDDAGGHAGRLNDRLRDYYGPSRIFRDVETIAAGHDFVEAINSALASCEVELVVIGPDWISLRDASGARRLDITNDFVRIEVAAGLSRKEVRVIPVLVAGASMPSADELPDELKELTKRQSVTLRSDRFADDFGHLLNELGGRSRFVLGLPRSVWAGLTALALAIAAVLLWPRAPTQMTGDLRVAVAQFVADDPAESAAAAEFSESVFQGLHNEISQLRFLNIGVWGPERTEPIGSAEEAEILAEEIDADVLVYGTYSNKLLQPAFYLRDRKGGAGHFRNAEELTGQYDLGSEIFTSSLAVEGLGPRQAAVEQLAARIRALTEFIIGLSWYVLDEPNLEKAAERFGAARAVEGWRDEDGKEVVYLFLGNVAGRSGELEAAQRNYQIALQLSGQRYARAHLGQAEVLFQRSKSHCEQGHIDEAGLRQALADFESARTLEAPPVSDIAIKATLGAARVRRCLSQALAGNDWARAEQDLRSVIADYKDGNMRIAELAAMAYAELALVLAPGLTTDPLAFEDYTASIEAIRAAITLTRHEVRRRVFQKRLEFFEQRAAKGGDVPGPVLPVTAAFSRKDVPAENIPIDVLYIAAVVVVEEPPACDAPILHVPEQVERYTTARLSLRCAEDALVHVRRPDGTLDLEFSNTAEFFADATAHVGAYTVTATSGDGVIAETGFRVIENTPRLSGATQARVLDYLSVFAQGFGTGPVDLKLVSTDNVVVFEGKTRSGRSGGTVLAPLVPPGLYQWRASQGGFVAKLDVEVQARESPRIRMLEPLSGPPGTVFRIALAGFEPGMSVDVAVYRGPPLAQLGSGPTSWINLGTISLKVDAQGGGSYELPSTAVDHFGVYCFVPPNGYVCYAQGDDSYREALPEVYGEHVMLIGIP